MKLFTETKPIEKTFSVKVSQNEKIESSSIRIEVVDSITGKHIANLASLDGVNGLVLFSLVSEILGSEKYNFNKNIFDDYGRIKVTKTIN